MKTIRKLILVLLLLLLVVGASWVVSHWKELRNFQQMPSGAYAKFMCSALFVDEVSEEQARTIARVSIPVKEIQIDYKNKIITTRSLFYTSTARYVNERFGCILE